MLRGLLRTALGSRRVPTAVVSLSSHLIPFHFLRREKKKVGGRSRKEGQTHIHDRLQPPLPKIPKSDINPRLIPHAPLLLLPSSRPASNGDTRPLLNHVHKARLFHTAFELWTHVEGQPRSLIDFLEDLVPFGPRVVWWQGVVHAADVDGGLGAVYPAAWLEGSRVGVNIEALDFLH